MADAPSPLLTRLEAAGYLRIGARTFDQRVRFNTAGPRVEAVRIGGRVLFRREDLDGWIALQQAAQLEQERDRGEVAELLAVNGLERRSAKASTVAAPPTPVLASDPRWLRVLHSPLAANRRAGLEQRGQVVGVGKGGERG